MRVYLPSTLTLLAEWHAEGAVPTPGDASPGLVYAVTGTLREWYREADIDELEHAAQVAAAVASLDLLVADPRAQRRRVLLAADLEGDEVVPLAEFGRAAMRRRSVVPLGSWACALIDSADAEPAVAAALDVLEQAHGGDDDAQFLVDELEDHDLGWYAVQELDRLTEHLR
jgi:hypothetical protein